MVELSWHYMAAVRPRAELHILAELKDGTYISGYMKRSYDRSHSILVTDDPLGITKIHAAIYKQDIKRWAALE